MKIDTRCAVVSDIHGNLPALLAVVAEIDAEGIAEIVNLGDIASSPLWPSQTVHWLMNRNWPTLRGNHERQALAAAPGREDDDAYTAAELSAEQRDWLGALPTSLSLADGRIEAFHASPGNDLRGLLESLSDSAPGVRFATPEEIRARLGDTMAGAAELLLCGHTHQPRVVALDGRLIVNPGSVGRPAYDAGPPHAHVSETGSPHARWAVVERDASGHWQAQLRATVYDWEAAARQAASVGFDDWAYQLRTGRAKLSRSASATP